MSPGSSLYDKQPIEKSARKYLNYSRYYLAAQATIKIGSTIGEFGLSVLENVMRLLGSVDSVQ
jgi:hypothetical protein